METLDLGVSVAFQMTSCRQVLMETYLNSERIRFALLLALAVRVDAARHSNQRTRALGCAPTALTRNATQHVAIQLPRNVKSREN
jgi:hypothetical protein